MPENQWPPVLEEWADYQGQGAEVGTPIEPFVLPDQTGVDVDFRQFLGFVMVIELGATWCVPCQEFAMEQQGLHDRLNAEHGAWVLTVLGQERSGGPPDVGDAANWAAQFGLALPVIADIGYGQQQRWSVTTWPTTLVVAPDGTVLHRHQEAVPLEQLEEEVADAASTYADLLRGR